MRREERFDGGNEVRKKIRMFRIGIYTDEEQGVEESEEKPKRTMIAKGNQKGKNRDAEKPI
jgi:hypothetical protein